MLKFALISGLACGLGGCVIIADTDGELRHNHADDHLHHKPAPGSNEMLRAPITGVEGIEVLISDVVIPAGATVPSHYHPGEEFVYVIEGSAIHVEEGKEDQLIEAGEAFVIPPEAIHSPRGGPDGGRAIVFRVHKEGQPERILTDD
ncbi:MAG: cupin domain-containing protein [Pseudomonadota bacterium]